MSLAVFLTSASVTLVNGTETPTTGESISLNADDALALASWGETIEIDPRVIDQIELYSSDKDELGSGYAEMLSASVRRLVIEAAARGVELVSQGPCEPFVDVRFEDAGFAADGAQPPESEARREFEEGFVRTEVVGCFAGEDIDPAEALRVYTSPEFRKRVSSSIKRIWADGDLSCVETKGFRPFLSKTMACNRVTELIGTSIAAQHSQVVSNPGRDGYQNVYFKESLKTFVRTSGGVAFHYINYTRTVKLGALRRSIGRKKVVGSQEEMLEEFRRVFSGAQPEG